MFRKHKYNAPLIKKNNKNNKNNNKTLRIAMALDRIPENKAAAAAHYQIYGFLK